MGRSSTRLAARRWQRWWSLRGLSTIGQARGAEGRSEAHRADARPCWPWRTPPCSRCRGCGSTPRSSRAGCSAGTCTWTAASHTRRMDAAPWGLLPSPGVHMSQTRSVTCEEGRGDGGEQTALLVGSVCVQRANRDTLRVCFYYTGVPITFVRMREKLGSSLELKSSLSAPAPQRAQNPYVVCVKKARGGGCLHRGIHTQQHRAPQPPTHSRTYSAFWRESGQTGWGACGRWKETCAAAALRPS